MDTNLNTLFDNIYKAGVNFRMKTGQRADAILISEDKLEHVVETLTANGYLQSYKDVDLPLSQASLLGYKLITNVDFDDGYCKNTGKDICNIMVLNDDDTVDSVMTVSVTEVA